MQYLGGKSRLAKDIAKYVNAAREPGQVVWEPFCGGFGATGALAKYGPVLASDVNPALITLGNALKAGWLPKVEELTAENHARYKANPNPDDPLTAVLGFGMSYGGSWFCTFAEQVISSGKIFDQKHRIIRGLVRDASRLRNVEFKHIDFVRDDIEWNDGPIYCDPPYAGTGGYRAVMPFDFDGFWQRVESYAKRVPVFISEFTAPPLNHRVVWAKRRKNLGRAKGVADYSRIASVDTLFRITG